MIQYLNLLNQVIKKGIVKKNRTKVNALTICGAILKHNLQLGFPLLTTKKMAFNSIKVELEFFIKGLRDKQWLQERGCHIWDEWCNLQKIPSGLSLKKKLVFQKKEKDLGKIYGYQWRNFNGIDQLKKAIAEIKKNPNSRQVIVSAWNPTDLKEMALPPCHVLFHLTTLNGFLNLVWFQRSCDLALGIPFNLASYSLLLHLIAKECKLKEGQVMGMLSDVHIYENHLAIIKKQLERKPLPLPKIKTPNFSSLFEWESKDTVLTNYQSYNKLNYVIAV